MLGTKSCVEDKRKQDKAPGSSIFWGTFETGWQVMKHCKVWGSTVTQGTKVRLLSIKVRPDGEARVIQRKSPRGFQTERGKTRRTKRPAGWGGGQRTVGEKAKIECTPSSRVVLSSEELGLYPINHE